MSISGIGGPDDLLGTTRLNWDCWVVLESWGGESASSTKGKIKGSVYFVGVKCLLHSVAICCVGMR